jgi:hypothetical protein
MVGRSAERLAPTGWPFKLGNFSLCLFGTICSYLGGGGFGHDIEFGLRPQTNISIEIDGDIRAKVRWALARLKKHYAYAKLQRGLHPYVDAALLRAATTIASPRKSNSIHSNAE